MCGRFAIDIPQNVFIKRFSVSQIRIALEPNYNIAPGMMLPAVIRQSPNSVVPMKWGLVPHWSREFKVKFSNINARAETIQTSAAYRFSFMHKRCLIPAIGFYEWAVLSDKTKWPYFFRLKTREPFAFAGIWDVWCDAEGKKFPTCAIVTCSANSVVNMVHPRMPVILSSQQEEVWIASRNTKALFDMLKPYNETEMEGYRIPKTINDPALTDKSLIQPWTGVH